jgi:hypothetical protein
MKAVRLLAATTLAFSSLFLATPAQADCVSPQQSTTLEAVSDATTQPVVRTITTCGGDDVGYQIPLSVGVTFDGQTFDKVYATTNSVITFGAPDGTYWDYPRTASISLYSMDWLILPSYRTDEHLIIQSSQGGFSVDISARPYGNYNVLQPTNIIITAAINYDGSVAISYMVAGPTYDGQTRTGVRTLDGQIITLEEYGIVQTEEPVVLPAIPEPSPEPVIPTPTPQPTPEPTIEPAPPAPAPEPPAPAPIPEPTPEITPPTPPVEPPPAPAPSDTPIPAPEPPTPVLEPVEPMPELPVSQEEQMAALAEEAKADDPQLPSELASIPLLGDVAGAVLEAFNAIGNLGADIRPEVRATAQKAVVSSVIVGQIATTASLTMGAASYRRNK